MYTSTMANKPYDRARRQEQAAETKKRTEERRWKHGAQELKGGREMARRGSKLLPFSVLVRSRGRRGELRRREARRRFVPPDLKAPEASMKRSTAINAPAPANQTDPLLFLCFGAEARGGKSKGLFVYPNGLYNLDYF
jgi:hypothetical protein